VRPTEHRELLFTIALPDGSHASRHPDRHPRPSRSVGFDGGVCTVVRVDDAVAGSGILQCLVTTSLKGGTITTQGLETVKSLALAGTEVAAITGGTGRFRSARGRGLISFVAVGKAKIELTISSYGAAVHPCDREQSFLVAVRCPRVAARGAFCERRVMT
jgi:hypothetical protein